MDVSAKIKITTESTPSKYRGGEAEKTEILNISMISGNSAVEFFSFYATTGYNSVMLCALHSFTISAGHKLDWISPMCAFLK